MGGKSSKGGVGGSIHHLDRLHSTNMGIHTRSRILNTSRRPIQPTPPLQSSATPTLLKPLTDTPNSTASILGFLIIITPFIKSVLQNENLIF